MESNNSSTTQIIIIIVLVVITIALFAYLIIISVQIPPYVVTPFANNSVIKIRSLANNLYLKPINCNLRLLPFLKSYYSSFTTIKSSQFRIDKT